LNSNSCRH